MASQVSMDYNRINELKQFDDTKAGVKGLVDAGIVNIPNIFIRPAEELAEELMISSQTNNDIEVPIIDLRNIEDSIRHKEIVDEIKIASKEWGVFQVINHGIPLHVLDEMIDGIRMFNEQDLELKKEVYSRDSTKKVRFNSNFDLFTSKTADWRDTLILFAQESDPEPKELPAVCRNPTIEYVKYVLRLGETLFKLLSEALGLQPDYLGSIGCGQRCSMIGHYYPACPQPELTMGVKKHTDPGLLNVLLQNEISGLQVLHENQWFDVHPVRGGLIVNVGDFLQIISNDKLKSVKHRAIAKNVGPRITVACFVSGHASMFDKVFSPIEELTSMADPPRYKDVVLKEYLGRFLSRSVDSKPLIDDYKL